MALASLEQFRENLGTIVRPNRFKVEIQPPSIYEHGSDMQKLMFQVKSTKIPSKSIGEYEMKWLGFTYKLPGDVSYEDLEITFINEDTWDYRILFEDWQDMLHSVDDASRTSAVDLLNDAVIRVHQINMQEEVIATYEFFSVFPKNVSEIELSHENENTLEEFSVTFSYSHWKRVSGE